MIDKIDLQRIFTMKEFREVRLHDTACIIKNLYQDIRLVRGWGSGYFCVDSLKIPRRTFYGWQEGSHITISYFLDFLKLWRYTCHKKSKHADLILKSVLSSKFSVEKGKSVKLPTILTDKLAYLIGYTLGDGCLAGKERSNYAIRLASDTKTFLKSTIQPLFEEIFSIRGHIYKVIDGRCYELQVHSKVLYSFFEKMFEIPIGKKKGKLVIPRLILGSSRKIKMAFISGFFDADGCIYEKGKSVSFTQADKKFLQSLSDLLVSEGILTRPIGTRKKEFGITYDFSIRWHSLPEFLRSAHFLHPDRIRRAANLEKMLN